MNKYYITFGQTHVHSYNNITLDKDCVGIIKASNYSQAREKAFEWFGDKFFTVYSNKEWNEDEDLPLFCRGYINLN